MTDITDVTAEMNVTIAVKGNVCVNAETGAITIATVTTGITAAFR